MLSYDCSLAKLFSTYDEKTHKHMQAWLEIFETDQTCSVFLQYTLFLMALFPSNQLSFCACDFRCSSRVICRCSNWIWNPCSGIRLGVASKEEHWEYWCHLKQSLGKRGLAVFSSFIWCYRPPISGAVMPYSINSSNAFFSPLPVFCDPGRSVSWRADLMSNTQVSCSVAVQL